jgi:ElaB/YqjD/DUF883 family membrane-anchored ribosome-binding protein
MATTTDHGRQTRAAHKDLNEAWESLRDTAQQDLEKVGKRGSECRETGRDTVHGVACACEQMISKRPLRSVLVAAGIGWLLGRLWKRS